MSGSEDKNSDSFLARLRTDAQALYADFRRGAKALPGDLARLLRIPVGQQSNRPEKETEDMPPVDRGIFWRRFWGGFAAAGTSLFFLGAIGGLATAFVVMAPRVPEDADLWNVNRQSAIVVLDRNGEEIAARGARYGEQVEPEELPDYLLKAFLSTEDRRFYDHNGVDIRGTLRAALANARSGGVVEGGSTITQQLAKNLFLSPRQTYERKIREALLALQLEGHYTKNQILSLYLNRIYLGAGAYGIESAAQTYFGKSARDVSLAEAAMLAGLPKAPSTYAPTHNLEGAQARAETVIDNLLETDEITPFEAREAKLNPAQIINQDTDSSLGYFFDYVAAKAKKLAPPGAGDIVVTTTIDQKLQQDAETTVMAALTEEAIGKGAEQAALIAYDAKGALRAMVGGRSYEDSQFNRATQARRQPGSAFKPFVYVAALEAGLNPQSRFVDQPVDFDGWAPTNYTDTNVGPVRMTQAVAQSINTVAAQVTVSIGPAKVAEAAMRFGVPDIPAFPAIALGAVDVTLEQLTSAYLPFASGGTKIEPYAIEWIETSEGLVIYQHQDTTPQSIITPDVAADMNHLLYQVMTDGTGARANLGQRDAMGKTGTTNDWRDAWFVGYTAQLTTGVWVGNDAYNPMEKVTGGSIPAEIWRDFMISAHQNLPLRSLEGAYPAVSYAAEPALVSFYSDVSRGLNRVRRDGDARRYDRRRR